MRRDAIVAQGKTELKDKSFSLLLSVGLTAKFMRIWSDRATKMASCKVLLMASFCWRPAMEIRLWKVTGAAAVAVAYHRSTLSRQKLRVI